MMKCKKEEERGTERCLKDTGEYRGKESKKEVGKVERNKKKSKKEMN